MSQVNIVTNQEESNYQGTSNKSISDAATLSIVPMQQWSSMQMLPVAFNQQSSQAQKPPFEQQTLSAESKTRNSENI